ncbi:hypothetical protein Glove_271g59 [Diversispora epigaea]|uniref:Uncharacterized protein n=1 Tax=Diversispora epigaea TaxID=1348612 RepID=A0A397I5Q4_9GLOM|nr:hypothetical protein Glove_271g59 [Diversispora epigaea]
MYRHALFHLTPKLLPNSSKRSFRFTPKLHEHQNDFQDQVKNEDQIEEKQAKEEQLKKEDQVENKDPIEKKQANEEGQVKKKLEERFEKVVKVEEKQAKEEKFEKEDQVKKNLEDQFKRCVETKNLDLFNLLRQMEMKTVMLKKKMEIQQIENENSILKNRMGSMELECLQLRGSVHVRGVVERWESKLAHINGKNRSRTAKWEAYLRENRPAFEDFVQIFELSNSNKETAISAMASQMAAIYSILSQKIHFSYSTANQIEWRRSELGNPWSDVIEYMCKGLKLPYYIIE